MENIIYIELISRGYEVFTGKTYKGEVDFVVIDGKRKCFIQVAYYLHGQETIEREFGAFYCRLSFREKRDYINLMPQIDNYFKFVAYN